MSKFKNKYKRQKPKSIKIELNVIKLSQLWLLKEIKRQFCILLNKFYKKRKILMNISMMLIL